MAEHDDEREASRAYRQLPREEPPASIDARIRAEARSAIEMHPAPLVPPTGRQRWYFPLAAAAVIVLAVAVTWQVEREQPDSDSLLAVAPKVKEEPREEPRPRAAEEKKPGEQGFRANVPRREITRDRMERNSAPPAAAPPQAASGALAAPQAGTEAKALLKQVSPEAELERIAELRRQGRDEEADKALAEFRKRHPDYHIAPEMLKRVEKKSGSEPDFPKR